MPDDLTPRVLELLAHYTETTPEEIDPEATFEDLALDSLDSLSLIADLEDAFDITISNDEAYEIDSVQEAIDLLRQRVEAKSTST